ncbi:MAG TPA: HNH endonuclease [Caldimonas sp.]|nr:HNH endonuclease [Caldimonas sp.]HEX2542013.1 HNH endonuclease [Caldimonas sp.]
MLSREAFSPDERATDGLQSCCRACASLRRRNKYAASPEAKRQRQRDYYRNNTAAVQAINSRSRAKHSDKVKAAKQAHYLRVRDDPAFQARMRAYIEAHKDHKREYDREYRWKNASKLDALKKSWKANNALLIRAVRSSYKARRRAIEKAGDDSRAVRDWLATVNKMCLWCGVDCEADYHIDHVRPLALRGAHRVANLAIACPSCNVQKNALPPEEFCRRKGLDFQVISTRKHEMKAVSALEKSPRTPRDPHATPRSPPTAKRGRGG